ncbi:MAG: DUF2059 domain-containing protein [bacterium]|nr:DUF2059 domain-containing protein [Candidatus Kapabacteria bacterium]
MKRVILTLALVVVCSTAVHAQKSNEAARAKVRELITLMGSGDLARQVLDQMMPALKQMAPEVPEDVWVELEAEMDVDDLLEQMIPIYIEEYSMKEIDAMLKFYRSSEGRSVIKKMPNVTARSMQVGQAWGQNAAMRVFARLKEKGYTPKS